MTDGPAVLKQVTLRRMQSGELAIFVGDDRIAGAVKIEAWCDDSGSYTAVVFANECVHFDTEKPPAAKLH